MQHQACYSNRLTHKTPSNTLDLGEYNLLRPDFGRWLSLIKPENQRTHKTPQQIIDIVGRIPEIRIINNLILPNWIINSTHDVDFGLYGLLSNQTLWEVPLDKKYKWIDARGITVYHSKLKPKLQDILAVLCSKCEYLIYQPHSFTTITEFWDWLVSCSVLTDTNRAQIIFMKPSEAKTYRTSAAGIIPLDIARTQHDFYKNNPGTVLGSPALINNILAHNSLHEPSINYDSPEDGSSILIQELDKLRVQLLAYQLTSPDELTIETGNIIDKLNDIRNCLGIKNS
jgi:hypothetical protein